jgi:hypothetical protein
VGNWGPAVSPVPSGAICSWGVAGWPPVGWDYAGVWLTDRYGLATDFRGVSQWGFAGPIALA